MVAPVIDAETGETIDGHHRIRAHAELRAEGVKVPAADRRGARGGPPDGRSRPRPDGRSPSPTGAGCATTGRIVPARWSCRLTSSAARKWDEIARSHFHELLAFVLAGKLIEAPLMQPMLNRFRSFGGRNLINATGMNRNEAARIAKSS